MILDLSHGIYKVEGNPAISRYIDMTKFISMLHKKALFFTRVDKLPDRLEGQYPENKEQNEVFERMYLSIIEFHERNPNFKKLSDKEKNEAVKELINTRRNFAQELRPLTCVNCWHENITEENALMWIAYAGYDKGIMIKSSYNKLIESIINPEITPQALIVSEIMYCQTRPTGNTFFQFLHKHPSYKEENEIRILIDLSISVNRDIYKLGDNRYFDWSKEESEYGVYIPINLDKLIDEIIVAPNAEEWYIDLIKSITEKYELNKTVRWSKLKG